MPSPLTSSFASAAAGNNQDGSNGGRRVDGSGAGEWTRTRTNGATQTFRRPSLATNPPQRESSQPGPTTTSSSGVYVPPHLTSNHSSNALRNGTVSENRYSKDQMLGLYKEYMDSGNWGKSMGDAFMGNWDPRSPSNGSNGTWGKKDDREGGSGPEVCWDHGGKVDPMGLIEMDEEERDIFSTSVNSPLKAPPPKDGTPTTGASGRKTSISQSLGSYNTSSPLTSRPGNRRRETGDSTTLANPLSPSSSQRFFRDETNTFTPPPSLLRRKTYDKDLSAEIKAEEKEKVALARNSPSDNQGFGSLKRSTTGPVSAGLNSPAPPWSNTPTTGFSPMGAFGNFSLGPGGTQSHAGDKKPVLGSMRGESRFKGLLSKDSSEDVSRVKEKSSASSLERLPEAEAGRSQQSERLDFRTRALRSESNPFGDEEHRVGSAALGGASDMSPPGQGIDQLGFSAFGLTSKPSTFREFIPQEYSHQQTPQRHGQESMSPTNTNPYQSPPEGEKGDAEDVDTDGSDIQQLHLPGFGGMQPESNMPPFGSIRRGGPSAFEPPADRSQNSSAGANRGFPNISGFPGLANLSGSGGWPGSLIGSPSRGPGAFPSGFGDSIFGGMGDLPSPNVGGLGANSFYGSPGGAIGSGTLGRGSKMGSLFPAAMQEQMRSDQGRQGRLSSEMPEHSDPVGRTLRDRSSVESGSLRGDGDGSLRGGRGLFGDLMGPDGGNRSVHGFEDLHMGDPSISHAPGQSSIIPQAPPLGSTDPGAPSHASGPSLDTTSQPGQAQSQTSGSPASNQLPTSQQRQMVMPDRMRWIYRDPQGNKQGPWSGLEMHDWYKAGFFTAELQVKKLEDQDYEPLAQLIRRIGNSREPFLVPQIGVPHGPPSNQANQWAPATSAPTTQAGVAQPPFANSFPSFGTTLTAEQQNALERRKQEEQYLMARQKEHLAQQQVMLKQMQQLQGGPHGMHSLQHHSSAHSLHSQPSFGSIASPSGYQPSPNQGPIQPPQPVPGFFENPLRQSGGPGIGGPGFPDALNHARGDELPGLLERMNLGRGGQLPFSSGPSFGARPQETSTHAQQVSTMLQDRARLQREQEQHDSLNQGPTEQQAHHDRLRHFHALQSEEMASMRGFEGISGAIPEGLEQPADDFPKMPQAHGFGGQREPEVLSLEEQVQKAAAASTHHSPIAQIESPWGKIDSSMPLPFPPPQSTSPLPAPAAQRNRQHVADQLTAESRSQNQTPIDTPSSSIAPWAKENIDGPKGPSLKEIQEAEARKAAQLEEMAVAQRRALAGQERMSQPAPAPAPGLPSTSTWGSSGSPSTPTNASSVWAKPAVGKAATAPNATKKTLAQIQKEEEVRKQRLAAANATQALTANLGGAPPMTGGKRYADLASKIASSVPTPTGAWTTVGASGKAKTPSNPVIATPVGPRIASGGNMATIPTAPKARPTTTPRAPSHIGPATNANKATDDFTKWAKSALSKGLNTSINVDDFVTQLLILPPETEIISDSVYANSQTLDGRRFAEEFIRRRKLADKGVVEGVDAGRNAFFPVSSGVEEGKSGGGGWSEVAKKGPAAQAGAGPGESKGEAFRVVPSKKKGKR